MSKPWKEMIAEARKLPDSELSRHASVSTQNRHSCKECFCCACETVRIARIEGRKLKFLDTDNGNCRVYYRSAAKRLHCFQAGPTRGEFQLLPCSADGEPEYEIPHEKFSIDKLPKPDCSTAKEFIAWATGRITIRNHA